MVDEFADVVSMFGSSYSSYTRCYDVISESDEY